MLHHPAPSPSLPPWNRGARPAPCRFRACGFRRSVELSAHCLGRTPLCSTRITRRQRSYGWLRLPCTCARVLAVTLVHGCPLPADRCTELPGYHVPSMSGSTRPRTPGNTRIARHTAIRSVACRGAKPVGTHPRKIFGAQHRRGRHYPLPLHLACFRTYASTCPLPSTPQGSILGSRRTITQAGLSPARTRGLARSHWPVFGVVPAIVRATGASTGDA